MRSRCNRYLSRRPYCCCRRRRFSSETNNNDGDYNDARARAKTILLVSTYLILSGLCTVLQTRIYKQLLIYSFLYDTFVAPIFQFVVAGLILILAYVLFSVRKCYDRWPLKKTCGILIPPLKHPKVRKEDDDDDDEYDRYIVVDEEVRERTTSSLSRSASISVVEKNRWDTIKSCLRMASLISLADAMSILPQIVLPSMLVALGSQFGLIVMMFVSYVVLGKRYTVLHAIAVTIVCLGMMVEIVPDYKAELAAIATPVDSSNSFFGDEYFHDRYVKRCVLSANVSAEDLLKDEMAHEEHVAIMRGHRNASNIYFSPFWWRGNGAAFVGCVILLVLSLFPACWSYAILENMRGASSSSTLGIEQHRIQKPSILETVFWIVVCRCAFAVLTSPFIFVMYPLFDGGRGVDNASSGSLPSSGGMDYFYSGWECTISAISKGGTPAPDPNPSYWECPFWKRGVDCENMVWLSSVYLCMDLLQYYLHVELIGKVGANTAWFYGMLRTGISDLGFSLPSLAGRTYSSTNYYDLLSFSIVFSGIWLFSVATNSADASNRDKRPVDAVKGETDDRVDDDEKSDSDGNFIRLLSQHIEDPESYSVDEGRYGMMTDDDEEEEEEGRKEKKN